MNERRETAMMVGHRLDNLGGEPEQFEVYIDTGEWVNPPEPLPVIDPVDEPITMTRTELADMVADAVAAAVTVQSPNTTTVELRQAARTALTQEKNL